MAQGGYEQIQNRKLISAYGGVQSIIETREGAVIIGHFYDWPYFETKEAYKPQNRVLDERFRARLRTHFPELRGLIRLPENQLIMGAFPENRRNLISASYFPKWMYCTSCHTFDDYDEWQKHWENTVTNPVDKDNFHPPKCYICYIDSKIKKKKKFYPLEQVRFIMTSPKGNIVDIPWRHWALRNRAGSDTDGSNDQETGDADESRTIQLNLDDIIIPPNLELKYRTSAKWGDLKGIIIEAYQGEKRIGRTTLAGIFNLRVRESQLIERGYGNVFFKTVLRSSNSVYYPNISQSIFLPTENTIDEGVIEKIRKKHERGRNVQTITEDLQDDGVKITTSTVQEIIENDFQPVLSAAQSEEQFRWEEYEFITGKDAFRNEDLVFKRVSTEHYDVPQIKSIYNIDRLRVTSVQTAYTRQKPIDKDVYLEQQLEGEVARKYTSSFDQRTYYLPAYQSYGEGVFIELNTEMLQEWEQLPEVEDRAHTLQTNFSRSHLGQGRDRVISAKYILLHTLSHLIIKELEFLCGYPAASLQERLYVSDEMQGILIYTVAGSEGSYGGLVSICKSEKIGELLKSALHRAQDCSSDPICYHTDEQGQGTAGLNLAACYSCALLPETSCEDMNLYLDRWMVIDEAYGYFSAKRQAANNSLNKELLLLT